MEKLLLQVGELIQTKRLGEAFDLTSISGWTPDIDVKVNQLINDKQICGIAAESPHCSPQKYIITLSRNCVYHMLDESLKKEAYEVLNRAEHFLVMKGHSKDLSEYCREISSAFNKIVDARSEFLDFNQKILVTLIKNSGIELDLLVGRTLFTCQLDGEELVTDLIELHSKCLQNLLKTVTSKQRMGRDEEERLIPITPMLRRVMPYINFETAKNCNIAGVTARLHRVFPNHHTHELRYTFITRCKESGVNLELVMMWDGHSQEKGIGSSVVDRGYTDYSKEFQLKQSRLVDYQQWDFPEPCYNSRPRPEDRFPNSKYNKERTKALAKT